MSTREPGAALKTEILVIDEATRERKLRGEFSAFDIADDVRASMANHLGVWADSLMAGQPAERVEEHLQSQVASYQENGVNPAAIDHLLFFASSLFIEYSAHEQAATWAARLSDTHTLVHRLFNGIPYYSKDYPRNIDHPFVQQVMANVRAEASPERWVDVLRARRFYKLTHTTGLGVGCDITPEEEELTASGLLSGDLISDWRIYAARCCPSAPWRHLESVVRHPGYWAPGMPTTQLLSLITIFGTNLHAVLDPRAKPVWRESIKNEIRDWELATPELPVWDDMRFIYAAGLYRIGESTPGRGVALDIKSPAYKEDLVETLLEWEIHDEAWGLTRAFTDAAVITRLLLSGSWPDAPAKRKKLDDILTKLDRKNANRYPPWLREGCLQEMANLYAEIGDETAAAKYAKQSALVRRQFEGGYFKYRGNGTWK